MIDDHFDADEILRDRDEEIVEEKADDVGELEFGTKRAQRTHFRELAGELEEAEDMWN